eukprot:scaffold116955_cov35-Attheya_sp.AAC.2
MAMAFDTDEEGVLIWKLGEAFCNGHLTGPGKYTLDYLSKRVRSHDVCVAKMVTCASREVNRTNVVPLTGVSPPEGLVGPFVDSSIKHHKLNYL